MGEMTTSTALYVSWSSTSLGQPPTQPQENARRALVATLHHHVEVQGPITVVDHM
jgi:hypothetical protein